VIFYLATLLGVAAAYEVPLMVIRIIGYILVIGTLYRMYAAG
jgi:hypothetical protein